MSFLFLDRWANFYLVASTAAATLLGLLFILITLAAERRPKDRAKIRLYRASEPSVRPASENVWRIPALRLAT